MAKGDRDVEGLLQKLHHSDEERDGIVLARDSHSSKLLAGSGEERCQS